ncbi:hypothetical protein [Paraburkholderia sp. GAS42]|uniref:hypothetical protein n=1 Tax=Paraburkholderia sp. GAS42 TaxID=3035135 RepID=UPI003D21E763
MHATAVRAAAGCPSAFEDQIDMVLVFICLDWIAPGDCAPTLEVGGHGGQQPNDAREECISLLASCIGRFEGAYPVLATRQMMGRRLSDIQDCLGELRGKIRDSVNTTGDSAYKLVSDFLMACDFANAWPFEWVSIADTRASFPEQLRDRVVEFSGAPEGFEAACRELARLLDATAASSTAPTLQETSRLLGDRRMIDAIRKRMTRTRTSS